MPEHVLYWTNPLQAGIFLVRGTGLELYSCRNVDAGVRFVNADAQLWNLEAFWGRPQVVFPSVLFSYSPIQTLCKLRRRSRP
jgi:hypothetical protein